MARSPRRLFCRLPGGAGVRRVWAPHRALRGEVGSGSSQRFRVHIQPPWQGAGGVDRPLVQLHLASSGARGGCSEPRGPGVAPFELGRMDAQARQGESFDAPSTRRSEPTKAGRGQGLRSQSTSSQGGSWTTRRGAQSSANTRQSIRRRTSHTQMSNGTLGRCPLAWVIMVMNASIVAPRAASADAPTHATAHTSPTASSDTDDEITEAIHDSDSPVPEQTIIKVTPSYTWPNAGGYRADLELQPVLSCPGLLIPELRRCPAFRSIARIQWRATSLQNSAGTFGGLGDIQLVNFTKYTWGPVEVGGGYCTVFPAATSQALGKAKWQVGPAMVLRNRPNSLPGSRRPPC